MCAMVTEYVRPSLMKLYGHAGIDFVFFEYEHTYFSPTALADTVLAARDNGLPPIAKTPQLERQEVAKLLECGVVGVQLPRTESRAQIEELRGYLKFPPVGTRAIAAGMGNSDYFLPRDLSTLRHWMDEQDAETTLIAHIETRLGYERAEEIVGAPGVDMVYVGPGDFSVEMGRPGQYDHPGRGRAHGRDPGAGVTSTAYPLAPPHPAWTARGGGSKGAPASSSPLTSSASSAAARSGSWKTIAR